MGAGGKGGGGCRVEGVAGCKDLRSTPAKCQAPSKYFMSCHMQRLLGEGVQGKGEGVQEKGGGVDSREGGLPTFTMARVWQVVHVA